MTYTNPSYRRAVWMCVAAGWLLTVVLGLLSDGVHHDDDLVHFLMARWSWWYPEYLINVWGRPGMTIPLAAVSWAGKVEITWHVARLFSATISAAAALIAALLAARLGIERPWRIALLCYLQPLFTLLSCTTLTENFTALYLIGAVSLLHARRVAPASCVFSMALLTRHEAVVFVPLWWWMIFRGRSTMKRPVLSAVLCLWAPIAHNCLYAAIHGSWPATLFFHPAGSTQYRPMTWGAYVPHAVYAMTIPIFVLAGVGAVYLRRFVLTNRRANDRTMAGTLFLIVTIPTVFFLLHAIFKALGMFASGGFARFMVAVAPCTAICAVAGLDVLLGRGSAARRQGPALLAAALTVLIWAAVTAEIRAGRLILPVPASFSSFGEWGRSIVDAAPHVLAAMIAAPLLFLASTQWLRRMRTARLMVIMIYLILTIIHWALVVRPLRLRGRPLQVARAVRWIEKAGYVERPLFSADPWFAYFCGLVEDPRAFKGIELLSSMPVGSIVAWDSIHSGSDYHGIKERFLDGDPAYRPLWTNDPAANDGFRIRLFEKILDTPHRKRLDSGYPPRLGDKRPAIRGVFYEMDVSRPRISD